MAARQRGWLRGRVAWGGLGGSGHVGGWVRVVWVFGGMASFMYRLYSLRVSYCAYLGWAL